MKRILLSLIGAISCAPLYSQILINEVQTSNMQSIADEDGSFKDWFELYNAGSDEVNLSAWSVGDNSLGAGQWILPSLELDAGEHIVIWASGKDRGSGNGHYETPVLAESEWQYLVPLSEPVAAWRNTGFNADAWETGAGGFGYADGDDGTEIPASIAVYFRKEFDLANVDQITELLLHMDYDDAFVAYLNGVEIARAGIGTVGTPAAFDLGAEADHEANGYQGFPIDQFIIDPLIWQALLQEENVLAVQVHNTGLGSSDLTARAFLSYKTNSNEVLYDSPPFWMGLGGNSSELHTNFSIKVGEGVYLFDNFNQTVDFVECPPVALDHSFARENSGSANWCYAPIPTPNEENGNTLCALGYTEEPIFSIQSGLFANPVTIGLTAPVLGDIIRYTIDGSVPNVNSPIYTGAFQVAVTTTVSARCFSNSDLLPSAPEKNTYLINEFGLDIPVICISTNPENLWDENIGIYVLGPPDYGGYPYFGSNFWEDWERESYMEYYTPDGQLQFEGPMGLKIHGGWSRGQAQKSFRVVCRDEYGMDEIEYPLIADKPFIDTYKSFNLRNGGNEYGGPRYHDALMQKAMKPTDADYMGYSPVVTFLNGEYWGMYELRENLNEDFCEDNHGLSANDATVISYNYMGFNVINGNSDSFFELFNYATTTDPSTDEFYDGISARIDLENYADYVIAETYYGNGDWSNGYINNYKFWHDDTPGGKWRFMLMDLDFGLGAGVCENFIVRAGDDWFEPDQIFARTIANPTFREFFILRYFDLVNTVFRTENLTAIRDEFRSESNDAMPRHCDRWGTDYNWWYYGYDWRLDWNTQRQNCIASVIQDHFGLEAAIDITLDVLPQGAGRIHLSTIEPSEMEYPWTGTYVNGIPIKITAIANPGYEFDHWNPNGLFPVAVNNDSFLFNPQENETFTAVFTGTENTQAIEISEFMYNDATESESGDWIEIRNKLDVPLDLSSMYFKDRNYFNRYDFPLETHIAPGEYLVLAQDPELFQSQYPDVENVIGAWDFGLNNNDDQINIFSYNGTELVSFSYDDESPWPANTDGTGRSVEFTLAANDQNNASNWFTGCPDGSPGMAHIPDCIFISVEENSGVLDWTMFPNPTEKEVFIALPEFNTWDNISLINLNGQIIQETAIQSELLIKLNTEALQSGLYILRISNSKESSVKKLMVK